MATLFRHHGAMHPTPYFDHQRVLRDLSTCRTAARGGHLYACGGCGTEVPLYNSCRNRHCPTCQGERQQKWLSDRAQAMLPVGHFHLVFTLPSELRPSAKDSPEVLYDILLKAAAETLQVLAEQKLGAMLGMTLVLHTWTRELLLHPHVHAMVTAGGLSANGKRWVDRPKFLFSVRVVHQLFRGKVLEQVIEARNAGLLDSELVNPAIEVLRRRERTKNWVVFIDPPEGRDVQSLLRYLGRYIYKVGIAESRVVRADDRTITFRTHGQETLTLGVGEFLDRFLLHVLPGGFRKIRHYGLYASGCSDAREQARTLLTGVVRTQEPEANDNKDDDNDNQKPAPVACPHCGKKDLHKLRLIHPKAHPWNDTS